MSGDQGHSGLQAERLHGALLDSPAYRSLAPAQQAELSQSMAKVFGYLSSTPDAPARQLAPDLDALRRGAGGGAAPAPSGKPPAPAPGSPAKAGSGGKGAVDRAGAAAQNLLGAIDFPSFVASLVQGTFQAIVDASIQQMEAYANLLQQVSKTVDQFMADNVTDDMARDHLADSYGGMFGRDFSSGRPQLTVNPQGSGGGQLPSFLQDLGFDSPADIDQHSLEQVVVPETRRSLAEMRHQTLATMVMMGINRVVVDDGEINAKLIFNVNASESLSLNFDESKPTNWTLAGTLGRNAFGASGIMVQTTNMNAQQDLNVRADLTGEVKINFRSETFPLERFADSAAIQLINTRATVPEAREAAPGPAPAANGVPAANGAPPANGAAAGNGGAIAQPQAAQPSRPVQLPDATADPWLPESLS